METDLDTPLQVSVPRATRARIRAIAKAEGVSQAQVVRDLIDAGIDQREAQSKALTAAR